MTKVTSVCGPIKPAFSDWESTARTSHPRVPLRKSALLFCGRDENDTCKVRDVKRLSAKVLEDSVCFEYSR